MRCVVSGSFDDLRASDALFLQTAAQYGPLTILLWSDRLLQQVTGSAPKFPLAERRYVLESIRWVDSTQVIDNLLDSGPEMRRGPLLDGLGAGAWVMREHEASPDRRLLCQQQGLETIVVPEAGKFPGWQPPRPGDTEQPSPHKKVIVTGCYDWLHSGHVRFFEEASAYGDLYVIVGNDANVRLLKGTGHPLFPQEERRFFAGAIRFVKEAWITSGTGWMDSAPEIEILRPDRYIVNEDGDRPEKRAFCHAHGIEYIVLQRLPRPGLAQRNSTNLRGF